MSDRRSSNRPEEPSQDQPPYSRLFIVCSKQHKEDDFKDAFSEYGVIEDVRMPRDRNSGEVKGVAYIKYSKTSEAAAAQEAMHMKSIAGVSRPIKVMVAASKSEIANSDEEKYRRLFITIAKTATEKEIRDDFSVYGSVDSIIIQRDRQSGDNRGFAYVKFRKFPSAALAFEECDRKYRPIFAAPKVTRSETTFESNINSLAVSSSNMLGGISSLMKCRPEGYTRLSVMCSPYLTQPLVARLFDLVPGMEHCQYMVDLLRDFGKAIVTYSNPASAAYAREKLNNFEYPPGQRIFVKPDTSNVEPMHSGNDLVAVVGNLKAAMNSGNAQPDLAQLAEAIAQASALIKQATTGITDSNIPDSADLNYCSVKLPPSQPLADIDSPVAQRCFIVCRPHPPPLTVMRDIFCRFGDLINVYTLPNKTVGYARYASTKAANDAMSTLHGAEICGVRIKVLEADERPEINPNYPDRYDNDSRRKRVKLDRSD